MRNTLSLAACLCGLLVQGTPLDAQTKPITMDEMHKLHQDSKAYIAMLEDPARDAYQKPHEVMAALGLKAGERIADIGAGAGYFTLRFAQHVGDAGLVYAVDISPDMILHLNERVRDAGLGNVRTILARPEDPLLSERSVDRIFICETWHHIDQHPQYLALLKKTLKPGGQVIIIDYQKKPMTVGPPMEMRISREDVVREFEQNGFRLAGEQTFLPYQYFLVFSPTGASAPGASLFEVYAVRYATAQGVAVSSLVAGADPARKIDIPFMLWVLRGPGGMNVLVDAGSYQGSVFERWKLVDAVKPSVAVAKVGLSPGDVTDVILTHIHWDHVGGVDLFPAARVWIQRDEFTHYIDEDGKPKDNAITADDAAMLAKLKRDGRLVFVDGDAKEIIPGVTVYTGGKHSYASQYVAARSAAGTVILASDSIPLYENLEKHLPLRLTTDQDADLRVQERMLHLASNARLIVPGHDPAVFARFPRPGDGVARIE